MKNLILGLLLAVWPAQAYQVGKFYSQGAASEKVIALTFDDGPGRWTEKILELLKKHNIRATFFMEGSQVDTYPEIARQVLAAGHEIGNHTFNHLNFNDPKNAFKDRLVHELDQTENSLKRAFKNPEFHTKVVRMPYGASGKNTRPFLMPTMKEKGYALVHWSFGTDWNLKQSAEEMAALYIKNAKPGAVFLFHDGGRKREKTYEAVTTVIESLQAKGYRFVASDELFKD